jgi:hypothetical protein
MEKNQILDTGWEKKPDPGSGINIPDNIFERIIFLV